MTGVQTCALPIYFKDITFTRGGPSVSGDKIDPNKSNPGVIVVSDVSADKAFEEVKAIVQGKYKEIAYEVGNCLLKYFFGGNVANIKNKDYIKGKSFIEFLDKFNDQIGFYSKSWLYTSLNLIVDKKDLEDCPEYQELSISHKVEVLYISDKEKKINYVKKIVADNLSVRDAKGYRKNFFPPEKNSSNANGSVSKTINVRNLQQFIKDPFRADEEFEKIASNEIVEKLPKKKKADLLVSTQVRLEQIRQEIEKHNRSERMLENLLTKLKPVEVVVPEMPDTIEPEEPVAGSTVEPNSGVQEEIIEGAPEQP